MAAHLPREDKKLVQIVDAAVADAARRSGEWLLCHAGCTQCCFGVFPISQLDALRLKSGPVHLQKKAPETAAWVRARAQESIQRLRKNFPGDTQTGILDE